MDISKSNRNNIVRYYIEEYSVLTTEETYFYLHNPHRDAVIIERITGNINKSRYINNERTNIVGPASILTNPYGEIHYYYLINGEYL